MGDEESQLYYTTSFEKKQAGNAGNARENPKMVSLSSFFLKLSHKNREKSFSVFRRVSKMRQFVFGTFGGGNVLGK